MSPPPVTIGANWQSSITPSPEQTGGRWLDTSVSTPPPSSGPAPSRLQALVAAGKSRKSQLSPYVPTGQSHDGSGTGCAPLPGNLTSPANVN